MPTEILTTIACEPGSEKCPLSCKHRVAMTTPFDELYRSFDGCSFDGAEIVNNRRTPSCLAAESEARELRERAEKAEGEWDHWKARYEQEVKDGSARFAEMDDRCHHAEHDVIVAKERADKSESECATLCDRLRTTAQILIDEIGAEGPKNAECAAREAVQLIKNQRSELAILRERLDRAEGLLDEALKDLVVTRLNITAAVAYDSKWSGVKEALTPTIEGIRGYFKETLTPTPDATPPTQTETVAEAPAAAPAPELTEEERKVLEGIIKEGSGYLARCSTSQFSAAVRIADYGLWVEKDGNAILTPAGREVLARDGQTPAIQAAVNEEAQKG
jgi:hypothetical protein